MHGRTHDRTHRCTRPHAHAHAHAHAHSHTRTGTLEHADARTNARRSASVSSHAQVLAKTGTGQARAQASTGIRKETNAPSTDAQAHPSAAYTRTPTHSASRRRLIPHSSVPTRQQDNALTTVCTHRQQSSPTAHHSREKTRMPQQISQAKGQHSCRAYCRRSWPAMGSGAGMMRQMRELESTQRVRRSRHDGSGSSSRAGNAESGDFK